MKKVIIVCFIIVALVVLVAILVGKNTLNKANTIQETVQANLGIGGNRIHVVESKQVMTLTNDFVLTIVEIDGNEYVVNSKGGIVALPHASY